MTQENINLLTLNIFFLINSTITGMPYIDEDYACYMFETKSDTQAFVNENENTEFVEARSYQQITFCTGFYSYGIKIIKVKMRQKPDYISIPVEQQDAKKQFYNSKANGTILRLMQTQWKKYLRELAPVMMFSPVMIDSRLPKQYPNIHYSYATTNQTNRFYVLFTTLQEFEKWDQEQKGEGWKPLEVNLETFDRIRKGNSVIINPMTNKLILTDKQLKLASEVKNGD